MKKSTPPPAPPPPTHTHTVYLHISFSSWEFVFKKRELCWRCQKKISSIVCKFVEIILHTAFIIRHPPTWMGGWEGGGFFTIKACIVGCSCHCRWLLWAMLLFPLLIYVNDDWGCFRRFRDFGAQCCIYSTCHHLTLINRMQVLIFWNVAKDVVFWGNNIKCLKRLIGHEYFPPRMQLSRRENVISGIRVDFHTRSKGAKKPCIIKSWRLRGTDVTSHNIINNDGWLAHYLCLYAPSVKNKTHTHC